LYVFPGLALVRNQTLLVSVLDLEASCLSVRPTVIAILGSHSMTLMFILSIRCQFSSNWTAKQLLLLGDQVEDLVEPNGIEPLTF
jgi:hypothetical protein